MVRTILLAGATGRTGRGFISAVTAYNKLSDESSRFRVLALSRAPDSKISQEIAKSPGIEVKKCDLTNQESVEKVFEGAGGSGSIWGVFCVLAFPGLGKSPEPSIAQGKVRVPLLVASKYHITHIQLILLTEACRHIPSQWRPSVRLSLRRAGRRSIR
jgi:hypothetical protein